MRITKRTNIAVRLLMYCAANAERLVTKAEIAECCNISENHLAQVINQLSQLGYLHTQRGRNGGMTLGRSTSEIQGWRCLSPCRRRAADGGVLCGC